MPALQSCFIQHIRHSRRIPTGVLSQSIAKECHSSGRAKRLFIPLALLQESRKGIQELSRCLLWPSICLGLHPGGKLCVDCVRLPFVWIDSPLYICIIIYYKERRDKIVTTP